jgi:thiamine-monophosphate kinase
LTSESAFIGMMRAIAIDPAARGLADDAAVLRIGNETLILTHDMMVESVHWLSDADPVDVAWKLVATNLSDLASKGAKPIGLMLGYMLGEDDWDQGFADGLAKAIAHYGVPLLGGDTTKAAGNLDARSIGVTAIGMATTAIVPSRGGAQSGDILYVTGYLGDAYAGYELARQGKIGPECLLNAFNRPTAKIAQGQALAPYVSAMMDVSDGLLIDAKRMAEASECAITIDLEKVPLSAEYLAAYGGEVKSRIQASSWGDDYQLLFAVPKGAALPIAATQIGMALDGEGLSLMHGNLPIELPKHLGFEHR